ncbi:hypothetical protein [Prosthecobacter sp.]
MTIISDILEHGEEDNSDILPGRKIEQEILNILDGETEANL